MVLLGVLLIFVKWKMHYLFWLIQSAASKTFSSSTSLISYIFKRKLFILSITMPSTQTLMADTVLGSGTQSYRL
jgi:hypothetical protein